MLKNMKIGKKILLGNIGIIMIMTLSMGILGYLIPKDILISRSREQSEELMKQLGDNFNYSIKAIESVVTSETFNPGLSSLLRENSSQSEYNRKKEIIGYGYNLISFQKDIRYVLIEDKEGKIYSASRGKDTFTKEEKESLLDYERAYELWGITLWKPYNDNLVFATKLLFDYGDMYPVGVISVGVDVSYFSEMYQSLVNNGNGIVFTNQYGEILIGTDDLYKKMADQIQSAKSGEIVSGQQITYDSKEYIYTLGKTKDNRIKIMNFLPVESITKAAKEKLLPSFFMVVVFATIVSFAFAAKVSGQISDNIKLLLCSIERISKGDFSEKLVPKSYDEIGRLAENFNIMSEKIQLLIKTVSAEKLQKKNSEIRALQFEYDSLQAKINPHFLYNTLESINSMAKLAGEDTIAESICMLGNYLREAISSRRKFVTVDEEIQNIRQYIAIQKLSYGDKIQAEYNIEEAVEEAVVPKLILQPLVENSIVHGIDPKCENGHIKVGVYGKETDVILFVEDDGVGIPEEKMENLMTADGTDKKHTKVGLYAVDKRVKILYGDTYGLKVESKEEKGTRVEVRIPIRFEDEVN